MFHGLIFTILLISPDLAQEATCSIESNILPQLGDIYSTLDTLRQKIFVKDEFHYLNVSRVGSFTVYDAFDCTFECLRNPSCFSVNIAASRGAKGQLWCELLSSDKYRNFTEYEGNKSSHHFSIKSPCSSTPCQNGGTCVANYKYDTFECLCAKFASGKKCEKVPESCKKLYDVYTLKESQLVTLQVDSKPASVYCHMGNFGCGNGGWTPVMKIDGNKATFHYNSGYWSNKTEYNPPGGETGFDSQETKLPTYWNTSFSKICIGMKIGQQMKFIFINMYKQANSLYSVIADGQYRATSLGRNSWKTLIGSEASLQISCNKEGFNAECTDSLYSKARIGIIGNEQNDCTTCDSRIGFGLGGNTDDSNTCGNVAFVSPDNGDKNIKAMSYILVQ